MPLGAAVIASAALLGGDEPPPPTEGFRVSQALSARASKIAGKPVTANCALDAPAWRRGLAAVGDDPNSNVSAFTLYEPQAYYVKASTCRIIEGHLRGRKTYLPELARELLTTTHEATHLKLNERDEAIVECRAIRSLRAVARNLYGFRRKA